MSRFMLFCFVQTAMQVFCYRVAGQFQPYDAIILFILVSFFFGGKK